VLCINLVSALPSASSLSPPHFSHVPLRGLIMIRYAPIDANRPDRRRRRPSVCRSHSKNNLQKFIKKSDFLFLFFCRKRSVGLIKLLHGSQKKASFLSRRSLAYLFTPDPEFFFPHTYTRLSFRRRTGAEPFRGFVCSSSLA
jgi:hypothetical protein